MTEFLNENKDKFEDCTKEQQKILACAAIDGELEDYYQNEWHTKIGVACQPDQIYRTKPKTISLQEAYEQMRGLKSKAFHMGFGDGVEECLAILERTEGFNK